jgi:hypothetical protein
MAQNMGGSAADVPILSYHPFADPSYRKHDVYKDRLRHPALIGGASCHKKFHTAVRAQI